MAPWERYHLDPPPPGGTPRSQRVLNWCLLVLAPVGMAWEWKTGNLRVPGGGAAAGVWGRQAVAASGTAASNEGNGIAEVWREGSVGWESSGDGEDGGER